jgi:superfamily II DNA or RNA helicase
MDILQMSPPSGQGISAAGVRPAMNSPAIGQRATVAARRFAAGTVAPSVGVVPRLTVTTETLFIDDGSRRGEETLVSALKLDFVYDGSVVRANDPLPRIYDMARMERGPIERNKLVESQARRVLEGFGAVELERLEDCAVAPGAEVDYVLRIDGDVHMLCAFSAYAVPQLRAMGWQVVVVEDYPWQVVEPSAPLYAEVDSDAKRADWFSLELGVEVDGVRINLLPALLEMLEQSADLEELAKSTRKCVAVRVDERRWLPIPPARLRLLCKVLLEMYKDGNKLGLPASRAPLIAELGAALYDEARPVRWTGDPAVRDRAYALAMGPTSTAATMPLPVGLRADLRPYQEEGVRWLQHLRANDAGGILADDMGLGKTLQTIAHILAEKEAGRADKPVFVLTLTSVIGNWVREFAKFAPSLKVMMLRGPNRQERIAEINQYDVVISTYPLVVRDQDELAKLEFHMLVLDEAHAIKNHNALSNEAVRKLNARSRICLSGTPIENHLGELWSLMDFLMPGMLGSNDEFKSNFRVPIEEHGDAKRLESLRERVRPYILRRTKDVVAKDLPPKTELVRAVELGAAQRELYESIRVSAHADVREHIKTRGIGGSTIAILDALLKLRQVCCDPRLVNVDSARSVHESAKFELLLNMVKQQLGEGRRILIFSQFARMLGYMSEGLLASGIGHVTLTGQTTDRQKPVDAFENGKADVFLISLRAGGTGLNLTSADTVIHYDPWWNPAAQAQATDRAYRIGQKKPVFAYNLIVAGSVEERMLALQKHKRKLADAILAAGDGPSAGFSEQDVHQLLAPLEA